MFEGDKLHINKWTYAKEVSKVEDSKGGDGLQHDPEYNYEEEEMPENFEELFFPAMETGVVVDSFTVAHKIAQDLEKTNITIPVLSQATWNVSCHTCRYCSGSVMNCPCLGH